MGPESRQLLRKRPGPEWGLFGKKKETPKQKREREAKEEKALKEESGMGSEEAQPTAEPVPAAEQEAFSESEQEYKPKPELTIEQFMLEASSTFCPRRSYHLSGSDGWKSCERCRAMLRGIAVQLAKENMAVLL
jgi:hypothetical protein